MPAQAGLVGGTVVGAGYPPGSEPAGYPPGSEPAGAPVPWYRQRGPLIAAILGGLLFLAVLGALLYWFFIRDDGGQSNVNRLILETTNELDEPMERTLTVDVSGPAEFPDSFLWLRPANSRAPEPAEATSTSGGQVEFRWGPTEDVGDMSLWLSSVTIVERIPARWIAVGPTVECSLERRNVADSIVDLAVTVEPADTTVDRIATYEFVDYVFQPGDTVRCTLVNVSPDSTVNSLVFDTADEAGSPVERSFVADVSGPAEFPDSFLWLRPPSAQAPQPAEVTTTSGGQAEFGWAPTAEVGEQSGWLSTITVTEPIPGGWTSPGPIVQCTLTRRGVDDSFVELAVRVEPGDVTLDRVVTYSFVSHVFQPGDAVRCDLPDVGADAATTTTTSSSTTTSTTTTSTVPVTDPPVTEPPPTDPPPTDPPPTDPPATEPPVADVTLWSVLESRTDLSTIRDLITLAGLQSGFEDSGADIGFFAPDNDAFTGVTLPTTEDDARELVQTHMNDSGAIVAADFADGPLAVVFGGPHTMDTTVDPPTLGGFQIIETDVPAAPGETDAAVNGVIHVLDGVLTP
jgi:hypothetical protein